MHAERALDTDTMPAVLQSAYGSALDTVRAGTAPIPSPGRGEVLIEVRAAAINKGDWHLMVGRPYLIRLMTGLLRPSFPILGQECAGVVVATGPGVTDLSVGDAVFGEIGRGAFARYALAASTKLRKKPPQLSFEQAAAIVTSGATALRFVDEVARVQPGQTVLVHGASGGVGHFMVQLAALRGASVTGVCSTKNVDLVRRLGAAEVIDYTTTAPGDSGRTWDVTVDLVGNHALSTWRRLTAPGGTHAFVGGKDDDRVGPFVHMIAGPLAFLGSGRRFASAAVMPRLDELDTLGRLAAEGKLHATIGRRCSLDEVPEALDAQGRGHVAGKTVVMMPA